MKEEDNILRKVGTENSFRVPEGYFENLTSQVMNQLPPKEKPVIIQKEPTRFERLKPWLYMAAMFVGAAFIIRIASSTPSSIENNSLQADEAEAEMRYINMSVNNSMMDDYALYVYLADAAIEE